MRPQVETLSIDPVCFSREASRRDQSAPRDRRIPPFQLPDLAGLFQLGMRILLLLATVIVFTAAALAQCVVDVINAPAGTDWNDMALYRAGGKLFVADGTGAQILVFDTQTLVPLNTIDLAAYLPDQPQNMVVHEGSGTLYVAVDKGWANSASRVVVIDADTQTIQTTLTGLGIAVVLTIDEARNRLYAYDAGGWDRILTAIDVNSNSAVGNLNVKSLLGGADFCRDGGLNPETGELIFTMRGTYNKFAVVQGPTLTGEVITAPNSSGWTGIWNYLENKVIIATSTWVGFCTYDRDTGTPGFVNCVTDSSYLFFNPATNRVYSSPEIEGNTVVIEGPSDQCREVHIGIGGAKAVFTNTKHHVYFVSDSSVCVRDEDTLDPVAAFPIPGPGGGGIGGSQAIVDPATERVFIRSYRSALEGELSCLMVIDDRAPLIGTQPKPMAVWYGQTATLEVSASGSGTVHYQWYTGARGDTSRPVGTDAPAFTTPPLARSASYWVSVRDDLGAGDSEAVAVTVDHSPGFWTKHPFSLSPAQPLNAVHFVSETTGWVVGNRGTIQKTTDGGATWQAQGNGAYFNEHPNDVWFLDALNGWAVGGSTDGIALRTADGGATWSSTQMALRMEGVRFANATTGWAVGMLGTVLKTVDGGVTWNQVSVGTSYDLYDIALPDASTILIVGKAGTVLKSIDEGAYWTSTYAGTVNALNGIFMWNSAQGLVATGFNSVYNNRGRIYGSADGGATWERRPVDADDTCLTAVHCPTAHLGWATGTGGRIFKTADGGANWFAQPSGTTVNLNDVFMLGVNRGFAVGAGATILYYTGLGRADFNVDGLVDREDLSLALRRIAGNPVSPGDVQAGDANRDGRLNILDALAIQLIGVAP